MEGSSFVLFWDWGFFLLYLIPMHVSNWRYCEQTPPRAGGLKMLWLEFCPHTGSLVTLGHGGGAAPQHSACTKALNTRQRDPGTAATNQLVLVDVSRVHPSPL